jgi:hypothetical protein
MGAILARQTCLVGMKQLCKLWVEAGESGYLEVLKTRNLLIFRDAKNAEHGKIAPNWNVSGTRGFRFSCPTVSLLRYLRAADSPTDSLPRLLGNSISVNL